MRRLHRDAVVVAGPALEHGDLVVAQVAPEPDQLGGVPGDPLHLRAGLLELGRGVDADHPARAVLAGEAGDHPGVGGAGDGADDDRVEEDAELASCCATSRAQLAKPSPPRRWSEAPAGMAYGVPPAARTSSSARSQQSLDADAEAGRVEPDVGAHDPREQDVADPVVDRVRPVHPALLHQPGLQPELGRDRGDLAGVVRLVAADRDERVGPLGQRVRDDVLELAGLVAAERQAGVAVLALGPDLRTAEVLGQPVERVHGARPEQQRVAVEVVERHAISRAGRRCRRRRP